MLDRIARLEATPRPRPGEEGIDLTTRPSPAAQSCFAVENGRPARFFAHLFGPAANSLLTDLVTPEKRVTAYALLRLAINGGFAAGPAVAGLIYSRSTRGQDHVTYVTSFGHIRAMA